MTSSATSATSKTPPSSISMSASSPGWASRHSERSLGCRATGASSRSATSNAAATWSAWPCVQMTASTSRSPTASSRPAASAPGSMTMTSSSSPTIQELTGPGPSGAGAEKQSIRVLIALVYHSRASEMAAQPAWLAWTSGQRDQAGLGGGEPARAVVETAQVVLEVHVQVLAARGLGAGPGVPDQSGANALAAGLAGDHDVLQPRVHQAVPQDVDEAGEIRT